MFSIFMSKWIKKCMSDAAKSVTKSLTMRMLEKLQHFFSFFLIEIHLFQRDKHLLLVSMQLRCEEQNAAHPKEPFSSIWLWMAADSVGKLEVLATPGLSSN